MRVLAYGTKALLVEVPDHHHALALYENIRREPPAGVLDMVSADCTLLITFTDEADAAAAIKNVQQRRYEVVGTATDGTALGIPTVYDGPDLAVVAGLTGMSVEDVILAHSAAEYVVAFVGFAPGFGYLTGIDPRLHVPRRADPRTRVPPGSVAIAGKFSAVYPGASPGGWQLLGRTESRMWDLQRAQPALLQPGTRVRFVPVGR